MFAHLFLISLDIRLDCLFEVFLFLEVAVSLRPSLLELFIYLFIFLAVSQRFWKVVFLFSAISRGLPEQSWQVDLSARHFSACCFCFGLRGSKFCVSPLGAHLVFSSPPAQRPCYFPEPVRGLSSCCPSPGQGCPMQGSNFFLLREDLCVCESLFLLWLLTLGVGPD